ncbi:family 2 encapsulin nanocompartment cargo protein terpene cyclase [Actinomadura parmotrematis]|uniref:Terpene synthase n=1 Tax=Actinomadura parmotrematis TaxID=2864039 RepID=A0ABS7G1Z0_9ACTN|nr:family 2 encapsulin nanocompartment cargo protein terpene cyclase [Actinomadura parmotrematis]MBW8486723.1 hypothetical protein [Actinomadura parmotrematis]
MSTAPVPPGARSGRIAALLAGPTGIGTASARRFAPRPSVAPPAEPAPSLAEHVPPDVPAGAAEDDRHIAGLYCPPAVRDDRALADAVNAALLAWVRDELRMDEPWVEAKLLAFDPGRSVMLCHPDAPSLEHLLVAGRFLVAENVVDDYYCEEEELGGGPDGLGARLLVAQSAIDPSHLPAAYAPQWAAALDAHPAPRSLVSAMAHFAALASDAQLHRFRHDTANLYLGYLAEAADLQTGRTPAVWEYLTQRQFNNFRPCLTITDSVGGYELPAELFARPDVQRATALASTASTVLNDLYSLRKEMALDRPHHNLPTVISAEDGCDIHEAFRRSVAVHNELVHTFEHLAAPLAPLSPVLARYLAGLSNWMGGNHEWHSGLVGTRYATGP